MTQTKSYLLLLACWIGCAALCAPIGYFVVWAMGEDATVPAFDYAVTMVLVMTPIFGTMFWAMTFEPPVVPPAKAVGWRRYRFLMWWAGLTAFIVGALFLRWGVFLLDYLWLGLGVGLFFAAGGWALGSSRADRARNIQRANQRRAFAKRAKEAILETAKSDPFLTMTDVANFLSKPYEGMAHLAENDFVRHADLSYYSGISNATIVPETVEMDGDRSEDVLPQYATFISLLGTLVGDKWEAGDVEPVVSTLEADASMLRAARLAKKI